MKAVIQRVKSARVVVSGNQISEIRSGFLTLLGVMAGDTEEQLSRLMKKILELRVFEDSDGKMNRSLLDTRGEHLIVSQFTLGADLSQGKRPSFALAEKPDRAKSLYEKAILLSKEAGVVTHGGVFGADMEVSLINDGPATFILEI